MKTAIDQCLAEFMESMLQMDGNCKAGIRPLLEKIREIYHLDVVCITEPLGPGVFDYRHVAYSDPAYDLSGQVVTLPEDRFEVALHMYDHSLLCINNEYDKEGAFPTPYNMHYGCVRGINREFDGAVVFMSYAPRQWTEEEQEALTKLGRLYRLLLNSELAEQMNVRLYEERRQKELMYLKAEREFNRASEQEFRAEHDALTGILNRAAFERITDSLRTNPHPVAFALMDVDNFKGVNDTYGHDVGDEILKKVANILTTHFRESDAAFRFGGDEFALILTNYKEGQEEFIVKKFQEINEMVGCKQVEESSGKMEDSKDGLPPVSVSAGAAFSASGYSDELFRQADHALYEIKRGGKGRCGLYCKETDPHAKEREKGK